MHIKILCVARSAVIFIAIVIQTLNSQVVNEEIVFFDEMDTVMISTKTADLVAFLEYSVMLQKRGDRPVGRYFDSYSTPFYPIREENFNDRPIPRLGKY